MAYGRIGGFNIRRYTFEPISKAKEEEELKEGDYTNWKWKWTEALPGGLADRDEFDFFIDDRNGVVNIGYPDNSYNCIFGIFSLSDFSQVFLSSGSGYTKMYPYPYSYDGRFHFGTATFAYEAFSRSFQTYVLLRRDDEHTIEVWRGGSSALWSHDIQDELGGDKVHMFQISPTGKWIIVFTHTNRQLICYEGS
jgi:hypothetical protein